MILASKKTAENVKEKLLNYDRRLASKEIKKNLIAIKAPENFKESFNKPRSLKKGSDDSEADEVELLDIGNLPPM